MIRKLILGFLFSLGLILPSYAQSAAGNSVVGGNTIIGCPGGLTPCFIQGIAPISPIASSYQQFTVASSTALPSIPTNAVSAWIICTGAAVNWEDDGGAPTTSAGMPLQANTLFQYSGTLSTLRIIQQAATATCNVSYYR